MTAVARDVALLEALARDPRFQALDARLPSLSLFRILGAAHDELAHSRLIAALLDPRHHAGSKAALRSIVAAVAEQLDSESAAGGWEAQLPS